MENTAVVRVAILARYAVTRAGLRWLLERTSRLRIVAEAASTAEAVAAVTSHPADVVVIDPDAEDISLRAVASLAEACTSRLLVFTCASDPQIFARAIELGASGIVTKDQAPDLLVRAVEKVHAGELWLDRSSTASVLSHAMRRGRDPEQVKIESLTKREREVVARVAEGLRNAAIAECLFISEATVRNHLTSILSKLALRDRFDLAIYAFRHSLANSSESSSPLRARLRSPESGSSVKHQAADAGGPAWGGERRPAERE